MRKVHFRSVGFLIYISRVLLAYNWVICIYHRISRLHIIAVFNFLRRFCTGLGGGRCKIRWTDGRTLHKKKGELYMPKACGGTRCVSVLKTGGGVTTHRRSCRLNGHSTVYERWRYTWHGIMASASPRPQVRIIYFRLPRGEVRDFLWRVLDQSADSALGGASTPSI